MKNGPGIAARMLLAALCLMSADLKEAAADVRVNVNIGPPPIAVREPPAVVLIPRSQVYFVPEVDYDVFFYNGYWWSPRGDRWYRAGTYEGPWRVVPRRIVPPPVYRVPRDYRRVYMHERHIPYGHWKKEHRDRGRRGGREWERERDEHRGGPPWERGEHGDRGRHRGRD